MNWLANKLRKATEHMHDACTEHYRSCHQMPSAIVDMSHVSSGAYLSGVQCFGGLEAGEGSALLFCRVSAEAKVRVGRNSIVMFADFRGGDITIGDNCIVLGTSIAAGNQSFRLGDNSIVRGCVISMDDGRSLSVGRGAWWYNSKITLTRALNGKPPVPCRCTIGDDSTLLTGNLSYQGGKLLRIGDRFTLACFSADAALTYANSAGEVMMALNGMPTLQGETLTSPSALLSVCMQGAAGKGAGDTVLGDDVIVRGQWDIQCWRNFSMGSGSRLWSIGSCYAVVQRGLIGIGEGAVLMRSADARDLNHVVEACGSVRSHGLILGDGSELAFGDSIDSGTATVTVPAGNKVS